MFVVSCAAFQCLVSMRRSFVCCMCTDEESHALRLLYYAQHLSVWFPCHRCAFWLLDRFDKVLTCTPSSTVNMRHGGVLDSFAGMHDQCVCQTREVVFCDAQLMQAVML